MRAFVTIRSAAGEAGRWAASGAASSMAATSWRDVRGIVKSIELGHGPCALSPRTVVEVQGGCRSRAAGCSPTPAARNHNHSMRIALLALLAVSSLVQAQGPGSRPSADTISAPISNVAYEVTFDKRTGPS